jgi:hypothetical protein
VKLLPLSLLALAALPCALSTPARADDINRISVGIGYYDVFNDQSAADFRVEYRPGKSIIWELRPWLGGEVTSDGAVYGAAGFLYDFHLAPQWILTPSLGAGLYADGNGKDLDSAIEFRSMVELGYEFQNASRLSAGLSHISNAGIGDRNPGTEVLSLYYHIPINWIAQGPGSDGY